MKTLITNIVLLFTLGVALESNAQCPTAQGDETTYGSGSWIGYVYDGANNFSSSNYQGYITETETFNESFCGNDCDITTNGCDVTASTFSIRFKMQKTFACGLYRVTIGGDDGVRLSTDGGNTYVIDGYVNQAYKTYTQDIYLNGAHDLVLDYYEGGNQNRVSFSYTYLGSEVGGEIGADQTIYQSGSTADPAPFTSISDAFSCSGGSNMVYQWEVSNDNTNWSNISGATVNVYDIPAGFTEGTLYYRRKASNGGSPVYSNTVTVSLSVVVGDQVTYGDGSWIGYVYDGKNNYTDYRGEIFEDEMFNENFGGNTATFSTSGASVYAETFTVRFKMRKTFAHGDYIFRIGGDDGVRLSIDGGSTFLINNYSNHGYRSRDSEQVTLNGTYDLVLEFYEDGGGNVVSFEYEISQLLPVVLTKFDGNAQNGNAVLHWATASEENNDYFIIERSLNGKDFQSIGKVVGNGTVTTVSNYTLTDNSASNGVNYYRLKQVDFSGQKTYSSVIAVSVSKFQQESISLYPNPVQNQMNITYQGSAISALIVSVINAQGETVQTKEVADFTGTFSMDLSVLDTGIYIVKFTADGQMFNKRIIVK